MEAMKLHNIEDVEGCLNRVQLLAREIQKHQDKAREAGRGNK